MPKISNYDEFDYDYREYWNNRAYEDKAEKLVLKRYLKGLKCKFFLDIGGSFGRNLQAYQIFCETPIILDYSLKTLKTNRKRILQQNAKTQLVAANAYHIPFRENTIDASLMIRVLHHIENQKGLFDEIQRVTKSQGIFILEYANKLHLKARLKWLLALQFKNFSTAPYQQPSQGNFEGAKAGQEAIFLNFHPKFITKLLQNSGFKILKSTSCSFFRINFIKKIVPFGILITLENLFQKILYWTNISPSIVLKSISLEKVSKKQFHSFEDILCCPKCKGTLVFLKDGAKCEKCNILFKKEGGVWDFRV